jgi:hypothetical protein
MPRLAFHPARHGFHFTNLFVNRITPHITTYGLCGGMVLAAARYWQHRLPIPTHIADDFPDGSPAGVPPPGSPLHGYIYDCQMASYGPLGVISAANWITMPWITHEDQFRWSANDEFPRIKAMIDVGAPVVLGLRRVEGGPFGHQVLAYGYDAAAQAVYVYDPNYPDVEKCLRLDHAARAIVYDGAGSPAWSSYFITGCAMEGPRPPYVDLGLQRGVTVSAGEVAPGATVTIEAAVRNFGFRAAHLRELVVTLRGPRGETLDASVGAGDGDPTPLAPGGERLVRRTGRVGASAGVYTVGVSYRSSAGELIPVPAIAGGTRSEVAVRVIATTGSGAPRWRSLGGILTSTPAVGVNADGRLEVFGRGQDDRMWRLTQTATGRDEFGGWELLPGEHTFAGGPAVVRNHWRKLELFARGRDGALWHRWQHEPDVRTSDKWSGWHHKGGGLACDPAVALNHDDRIEVLVIGTDARVHRIYQRWFDAFGAPWSGWEPIGSRRFTGRPAVERDGSGCLVAYARSADDHSLWRARQVSPSGPWADWVATGGVGGDPALGRNADGRLEAFVRGTDGRIWHQWQASPGGDWSGWAPLGADPAPILDGGGRPTVFTQADGRLAVAGVESDREAHVIVRVDAAPYWTPYQLVGSEVSGEIAAAAGGGMSGLFALGPGRDLRVALRRP